MKRNIKEFLAQKEFRKYCKENKQLIKDYRELCHNALMFKVKWGIEIDLTFKNYQKLEGRKLDVRVTENIINSQSLINKLL